MNRFLLTIWNTIRRDSLAFGGFCAVAVIIVVALAAPIIATHDPNEMNYRVEGSALWIDDPVTVQLEQSIVPDTLRSIAWDGTRYVAVGESGTILGRSDAAWEEIDLGVDETLRGVSLAGQEGLAVGDGGRVLRFDGGSWFAERLDESVTLLAAATSADSGMLAVGERGSIYARGNLLDAIEQRDPAALGASFETETDGGHWRQLNSGVTGDLHGAALSDGLGFIVGARGIVLRLEDGGVEQIDSPVFRDLNSVSLYDRENGLAVGDRGTVLRWDGSEWSEMQGAITRNIRSVTMTAPDRAVAVGTHGDIMILEDDVWTRVRSGYDRHFRGSAGSDTGFVVVGTDPYINALSPPSGDHLFGTTHNGRDIFSQVIYGSRTALMVGFIAAVMVTVIGTNVGLVSGYFKGRTDSVLMRIVDIMYAIPLEPFAMVLVLLGRPGIGIIILAVGLLTWRTTARLIRSQVLSLAGRPFVKAARVAGSGHLRVLYVHIAPNVLPLVFLQLAVAMAFAITAEATLSFLGLGPPRLYSWGTILHQARLSGAWRIAWWWVVPPGVLIMITVVSVFFISRALEVIANPRLSRS